MRGKFKSFILGILMGILIITLIYFSDEVKRFIVNQENWINWILLITTAINTALIVYILRLTKRDDDKR